MKCARCRELVSLELDDRLPVRDTLSMRRHLDDCVGCSAYAHDMRRILGAAQSLATISAPEGFADAVEMRLSRTRREQRPNFLRYWRMGALLRPVGALAAAAGALVVIVGMHVRSDRVEQARAQFVESAVNVEGAQELVAAAGDPLDDLALVRLAASGAGGGSHVGE
jgi:anti-sigma factor RsiW